MIRSFLRSAASAARILSHDSRAGSLLSAEQCAGVTVPLANIAGTNFNRAVIVVGNEAADADSIVSAIALAYVRALVQSKGASASTTNTTSHAKCFIPVANVSRDGLCLRRDVQNLLSIIDVSLDDIICLGDVNIPLLSSNIPMDIILTDHNSPAAVLAPHASAVTEIWDHHNDIGALPAVQGAARNIAYDSSTAKPLVGSACTLIAEYYFACLDAAQCEVDRELATLLLGVIALDTFNMDVTMGKGTTRDEAAMNRLQSQALRERGALFTLLRDAKLDPEFWRGLSAAHAFFLDYKEFRSPSTGFVTGVPSVLLSAKEFVDKPGVFEQTASVMRGNSLNAVVAMALETQPVAKRSLYLATLSEELTNIYVSFLMSPACSDAAISDPVFRSVLLNDNVTRLYIATIDQGNTKYSRKQMADYFIRLGEAEA